MALGATHSGEYVRGRNGHVQMDASGRPVLKPGAAILPFPIPVDVFGGTFFESGPAGGKAFVFAASNTTRVLAAGGQDPFEKVRFYGASTPPPPPFFCPLIKFVCLWLFYNSPLCNFIFIPFFILYFYQSFCFLHSFFYYPYSYQSILALLAGQPPPNLRIYMEKFFLQDAALDRSERDRLVAKITSFIEEEVNSLSAHDAFSSFSSY